MENEDARDCGTSKGENNKTICCCSYCDNPVLMSYPFYQACKIALKVCSQCYKPVAKEDKTCPNCGADTS